MNTRVFTIEEAHALLPQVKEIMGELRRLREEVVSTRTRIDILETLWSEEIWNETNPDADEYRQLKQKNRAQVRRFRIRAEELDRLGCHVKDLEKGIVGFFHVRDGQAVFMSWCVDDHAHVTYEEIAPNAHVFSMDEARRMLPRLRRIFEEFDRINERLVKSRHELGLLEVMWGEELDDDAHPDASRVDSLTAEIQRLVFHGRALERELHRAGCQLKDFQNGLVDFFHVLDGKIVFLCWRRDEPDIMAWHPYDAGFAGRQPLNHPLDR